MTRPRSIFMRKGFLLTTLAAALLLAATAGTAMGAGAAHRFHPAQRLRERGRDCGRRIPSTRS